MADPTRRRLLDLLSERPRTTGELCERVPRLSRTGVMKHLAQLEDAGLIVVRREGRHRWNHLNPVPIERELRRWLSRHTEGLSASLRALKRTAEAPLTPQRETQKKTQKQAGKKARKKVERK